MRRRLDVLLEHADSPPLDNRIVLWKVGGDDFQIRAVEAMPCVFWAFFRYWDKPTEAISAAIGFGGDTDTIASMV